LNKIFLIGHVGAAPAIREAANRDKYCHLSLATDEYWVDAGGARQKRTEWHSVFLWGAKGESAADLLKQGSKVFVEGRLESRPDPEAGNTQRRIWSVKGLHYELLDRRVEPALPGGAAGDADTPGDALDDVPL